MISSPKKAYQQLKREMESKQRNKQREMSEAPKSEKPQEVIYVDRDRSELTQFCLLLKKTLR